MHVLLLFQRGLFFTCRQEKYIQYYTIIYSIQYLHVGFLNAKIPYWVGAISARCENHSTLDHVQNWLPASYKPLAWALLKHVTQFKLDEDDIATSNIFFIRDSSIQTIAERVLFPPGEETHQQW
jgi:hypothetical protein